jgi:hypothetical protein
LATAWAVNGPNLAAFFALVALYRRLSPDESENDARDSWR